MTPSKAPKKKWVKPNVEVYGDMTVLTQQSCTPPNCKPKSAGLADDLANNISEC